MLDVVQIKPNLGVFDFPFKDNTVYSFTLTEGKYLFEVWGASGGNQSAGNEGRFLGEGGKGGYSKGVFNFPNSSVKLFCYVGGEGSSQSTGQPTISKGGFNGGGSSLQRFEYGGGSGGGGSTDICTIKSEMTTNNERTIRTNESYKSRIIVAGGGGGAWGQLGDGNYRILSFGGNGGGSTSQGSGCQQSKGCSSSLCDNLNQGDTNWVESFNYVIGSTQTNTGIVGCTSTSNNKMKGAKPGSFGFGGSPTKEGGSNSGGGGGGGWFGGYGGTSGNNAIGTGGAGGSGYIHNATNHNSLSSLNSKYYLKEGQLYDGSSTFPSPTIPNSNEIGHLGHGYARITLLLKTNPKQNKITCFISRSPFLSFLICNFVIGKN